MFVYSRNTPEHLQSMCFMWLMWPLTFVSKICFSDFSFMGFCFEGCTTIQFRCILSVFTWSILCPRILNKFSGWVSHKHTSSLSISSLGEPQAHIQHSISSRLELHALRCYAGSLSTVMVMMKCQVGEKAVGQLARCVERLPLHEVPEMTSSNLHISKCLLIQ